MTKTIVMIHGMWGGGWYWENFKHYFEEKGWQCHTPTLRYHDIDPGEKPDPGLGTISLTDYARDLEEYILNLVDMGLNWGRICELSTLGEHETKQVMSRLLSNEFLKESPHGQESLTRNITNALHNLIKFTIQLNRPNTVCFYETIDFAQLYKILNYKKSDKQILSVSILAKDDYNENNCCPF